MKFTMYPVSYPDHYVIIFFYYHYSIRVGISWAWTILITSDVDPARHHPGAEVCVEKPRRAEGWSL